MECDRQNVLSLWTIFWPSSPLWTQKIKIFKKWKKKNTWRYYHFTNVYHKWQSYDIWFFRYGVQQTNVFAVLDRFFPFYHPSNPKNENFKKLKKEPLKISSFYTSVTKIMIICYTVPWIWHVMDVITFHFGPFFAPLPPNSLKNKN